MRRLFPSFLLTQNKSISPLVLNFLIRISVLVTNIVVARFLGSEGIAIMTTSHNIVLFSIFMIGLIFLFRLLCFRKKKSFPLKLFYIFICFFISLYFYIVRVYMGAYLSVIMSGIFIYNVSGREVIPHSGPSGPSTPSSWTEDSFDMQVLLESFSETEMDGASTSVNQREARPPLPANPVASRGEEAGPSNRAPPTNENYRLH